MKKNNEVVSLLTGPLIYKKSEWLGKTDLQNLLSASKEFLLINASKSQLTCTYIIDVAFKYMYMYKSTGISKPHTRLPVSYVITVCLNIIEAN